MPIELPKQYDPREAQQRWLQLWNERGYFHSRPDPARQPFCIVIPPPNVTGALHMGHALNNTLQDVLIRWRRMQGYNVLWMPGTDHAGIATQAVVERRLREEEKKTRHDLGREELVKRIWQWKDQYEARILRQLRELGCSCDWARTRFTLDPVCARAVRHTFFNLFRDGLIYRGKRLVNWDTHLQTAVADDEIFHETVKGGFWTFRYPVQGEPGVSTPGSTEFIRFSTTRPETMLGDTAVAVHPDDPRYQHLIGKTVTIPLVKRDIPIIADPLLVDPKLGTGAVKVTPAHDPNDYACGQRHRLPMINILNPDGTINANGGPYAGMERYQARERVTEDMEKLGLFDGREDRDIELAHSDRSKTPIEPYLSDQWFVQMKDLAQAAMAAVEDGRVQFFPSRYAKTYLDWLGEKRDWCISRQLWWGHRIPIWYARCPEAELKKAFAGRKDVAWHRDEDNGQWLLCALEDLPAGALGSKYPLERDPDVLDTWFSSALWPHSTLGWPGPALPDQPPGPQNPEWREMKYYYPTSVLVTSRDIITLWVARMVITGLYNVGQVPFHHVYIHPKILDGFGEGMNKSKGNGIDPLDIIERYGTDALRFGMVYVATETQDSRMPVANVCPHCDTLVPVRQEHMSMRTRKVTCPHCKKPFRPGGPWPAPDPELPTAKQASERFEPGRNFANKLWNAARFLLLNMEGYRPGAVRLEELPIEDRWILSRLATTAAAVTEQLEGYHFSDAARTLYDFTWSEFCDWYVEMSKGRLRDTGSRAAAQRVLVGVLDAILRLVQPILPFVAESIWQALADVAPERGLPSPEPAARSVVIAPWVELSDGWQDPAMEKRMARMQDLVRGVREVRNRYGVDPKTTFDVFIRCPAAVAEDFRLLAPFITTLATVGRLEYGPDVQKPPQAATQVHGDFEAYVSLKGLIDVSEEVKRLDKQLAEKKKHLQGAKAKLDNASFTSKAPAEVVQQQRELVADLGEQIQAIESNLQELRGDLSSPPLGKGGQGGVGQHTGTATASDPPYPPFVRGGQEAPPFGRGREESKQLITVGHSPDPDDAFMFYALAHDKIDTGNLRFRHELQDIETLNRRALRGELEVTAVSIHAYALLLDKYALLPSGCSMGDRYGPMVVARRPWTVDELKKARIAVPGTLTTAFLTLRLLLGDGFAYEVLPFDQILGAVQEGKYDAGLIIHEGQLTYQNQGLQRVVDLGVWWQEQTGLPLPLGGNVVRRDLGAETIRQISRLLKESIRYALDHRSDALEYALRYARDMDKGLADQFVGMYVNAWTLDYGPRGREAVRRLLDEGHRAGVIPSPVKVEFVE